MKMLFLLMIVFSIPALFFLAAAKLSSWRNKILFTGKRPSATSVNKHTWDLTDEDFNSN
jgi:hypothetical protein